MDLTTLNTTNNSQASRFELKDGDELLAFIDYKVGRSGNWYLIHTEVVAKERHGIGNKIVRESLAMLDEMKVKIIPSCPFVKAFIKRHTDEFAHLLAEGFKL